MNSSVLQLCNSEGKALHEKSCQSSKVQGPMVGSELFNLTIRIKSFG